MCVSFEHIDALSDVKKDYTIICKIIVLDFRY